MWTSDTLRIGVRISACWVLLLALAGCAANPAPSALNRALPSVSTQTYRADPLAQLQQDILVSTRRPGVSRAGWGIVVHSLDRNERLFELNSQTLFVPASVAKLVTLATAAEAVGWNYRYETSLRAIGPIADGTLRGDLLIAGSGDPSIGGRGGSDLSAFVNAVKAAGIQRIEGRIVGDDDAIEEPRPQLAWAWDDLGYTTGAIFGALNLEENRTNVTIAPAAEGTPAAVTFSAQSASRPIVNRTVTGPRGTAQLLWPEQRPGEPALTIAGTIPAGARPVQLAISVGNPTLWFASRLRARLLEAGVTVTGEAVDVDDLPSPPDRINATTFFTYQSPALGEIARPLLKDSINVYGEALMRLNTPKGSFPTNDAALEGLRKRLTSWGIAEDSYQLVDGSGLSRRDAISADALLGILRRMHDPAGSSPFMIALPIAGVDGSLERRMKGTRAEGNVRAKTGTMSNIRSLAGYVTTRDGERLAFVILINNFEGEGTVANQATDAIAVRLAEFSR